MTLSLMWMVMMFVMVMFALEISMFSALAYMFVVIFLGSGIMVTVSKSVWMSMIFLIFMIGGLMVSFFYMVSLTHNMVLSISPLVLFFSMLLIPSSHANLSNFHEDCMDYFLFSPLSYMVVVLFMLFLLFMILFMIDFKLKALKGFLKGI